MIVFPLLIFSAILFLPSSFVFAQEIYAPLSLSLTVYSDGVVSVSYVLNVNTSAPNLNFTLFGYNIEELIVVDENDTPLDYTLDGSIINVDSLGASEVVVDYNTPDLTSKTGLIWTLAIDAPMTFTITFPPETTIVEVSQAPVEIRGEDQRPILVMPLGPQNVSYVIGAVGTKGQAMESIDRTEKVISEMKARGIILTDAEEKLAGAKNALEAGNYTGAEILANQALSLAYSTEQKAESASSAIKEAKSAIEEARTEGRTSGLDEAETLLQQAQDAYDLGNYVKARDLAEQAKVRAQGAGTPLPLLPVALGVGIIVAVSLGVLLSRKRRKDVFDIEGILENHPWLRPEQRSVLLLLAEKGGGAFEAEIRNVLDLPKSTTWRIIRRLEEEDIVDVQQIRGQNYVKLKKMR